MSKTGLNQIAPADLVADFGVGRLPLPLPRRPALRTRRRLQLRGDGRPLQRRPGEQLREPREPCAQHGRQLLRRRRSGALERTGRSSTPPLARSTARARTWTRLDFASACAAVWELIRAANSYIEESEPWKLHKAGDADGDRRRARATASKRCASWRCSRRRSSRAPRTRCGGASASRARPEDQRLPDAASWGGGPSGTTARQGRPVVPAHRDLGAHERVDRQPLPRAVGDGRGRRVVIGRARDAGVDAHGRGRHGRGDVPRRARPRDAPRRRARDRRAASARRVAVRRRAGGARGARRAIPPSSRSARPASTSTTAIPNPTNRSARSGRRSSSRTASTCALVIHSRDAWDDTFRVLAEERPPAADGVPLLHRWARRGPSRAGPRCVPVVQRDRVVPERRRRPGRRGR